MTRTEEILQHLYGETSSPNADKLATYLASLEERVNELEHPTEMKSNACEDCLVNIGERHLNGCKVMAANYPKEPASWEERLGHLFFREVGLNNLKDKKVDYWEVEAFIAEEKKKSYEEGYARANTTL